MRIVVLDGYAINPGDLSWDGLAALGDVTVHDRTPPAEVRERAQGADVLLTNKAIVDRETIEALPNLRYIGVLATGYNIIDVAAASERGITVTNVPGYSTASTAQATFALLLELTNRVGHLSATVNEGRWTSSADFSYSDHPLIELDGLTMGVIGFGNIGQMVARLALAFGMKVLVHSRTRRQTDPPLDVTFEHIDEVFERADVLSLHCPLTPETRGLVNADRLARMKPTALLLNAARGPLIDETALADALNSGRLAGAGLDVLSVEPPRDGSPLIGAKNCVITPHVAWATVAARTRGIETAVRNLATFQAGQPVNVVS